MGAGGTRFISQPVGHREAKYVEFEAGPERRRRAEAAAAAAGVGAGEVERHWESTASAPDRTLPGPRREAPHVFLAVSRAGRPLGRLVVELFEQDNPRGARYFQAQCCGGAAPPPLRGSKFHRVLAGFAAYGGAGVAGGGAPGGLGNPRLQHSAAGAVSLSVTGGEFLVTLGPARALDPEHQVVGVVRAGLEVLKEIGDCPTGAGDSPAETLLITGCGPGAASMSSAPAPGEEGVVAALKEKSGEELAREAEQRTREIEEAVQAGLKKRSSAGSDAPSKRAKTALWALEMSSSSSSSSGEK